jgi:ribosomal protein S21
MKDNNSETKKVRKTSKNSKGGDTNNFSRYDHIQPIEAQPLEVKVYGNNFDRALRAFRALVQKERILSLYKEKQSFEKRSDKRRRKRNEMKRKLVELGSSRENPSMRKVQKKKSVAETPVE